MKALIFTILFSSIAIAAVDKNHLYFQYQFEDKVFIYKSEDLDWKKSMQAGTDECMAFFKADPKNEYRYVELINVCVNPE